MPEAVPDVVMRVAKAISGAPFPSAASIAKAHKAIAAYEDAQAGARRIAERAQNIAWLHANIAQVTRFMERSGERDPIGRMQWDSLRADYQRQLDAALAQDSPADG